MQTPSVIESAIAKKLISYNPFLGPSITLASPTTESQRELWATLEMEENATLCYNESVKVELKGFLNTAVLSAAYREVLRRHDSLRSVFSKDGKSFCVTDRFDLQIYFHDYSVNSDKDKLVAEFIHNETLKKFDLVHGPAIELNLIKLAENNHLLFLTAHHIICDGWSLAVILNELGQIYSAYLNAEASKLDWPSQFFNYAIQEFVNGPSKAHEKFWLNKFKGPIKTLDIPVDFERPAFRTYNSKRIDKEVPKNLVKDIKKFGAKAGCSYYNSLMAVFEILLHKITNENELVIGISAAAQSVSGAESLVGHLVNLLPIKQEINTNDTFKEFLKKLKSTMLDAFEHQNYTFGSLLKALNMERDASRIPLVNIIFNVDQQYPGQGLEFEGIKASYVSNPRHYENFEIFINATSCDDSLVLECQYNENLFSARTISNWLDCYVSILNIVTSDMDQKIHDIKLENLIIPVTKQNLNLTKFKSIEIKNSLEEKTVALIWEKVLGITGIPYDANFFTIGGHSLLGIEVTAAIMKEFDVKLSLKDIFEAPTISQLALKLKKEESSVPLSSVVLFNDMAKGLNDIPTSLNQLQTWYLEQINPKTTMHNLPAAIHIPGSIDRKVLEQTLNYLVARHPALRTAIIVKNGQPFQKIYDVLDPIIKINLEEIKCSEDKIQETLNKEANYVFDLSKAPLLKAKLYKLDKNNYVFYFMVHHIIWDGWCFDIFFEELNIVYDALLNNGKPIFEKNPEVSYADFTLWNNEYVKCDFVKPQLDFWKAKLSSPLPVLNLPLDFKRPINVGHVGETLPFTLPNDLACELRILAQNNGTSLFNVFLTAFKITLANYSESEDIIVGSPVRGRNLPELNNTIGFFVNTLALRSRINLNASFETNLNVVTRTGQEAFGNQEIPFQIILNEVQWERDSSRTPIFQSFFSYQDVSNRKAQLAGKTYGQINVDKASTHSDLDMWIKAGSKKIEGAFEYRKDLFKNITIQRFSECFIHMLNLAVKNSKEKLSDLDLIPSSQKHMMLEDWNLTKTEIQTSGNLHQLISEIANKNPNKIAVVCGEAKLTYLQLERKSCQWANALVDKGIKPGDFVGLSTERNCNMLVALLAILKTGAAYIPLDPSFPQDRLDYMIESSKLQALMVTDALSARFNTNLTKISIEKLDLDTFLPENLPRINYKTNDTAYIIYTSGSTGLPKGVQISHHSVVNFLLSMQKKPGMKSEDNLLAVTTLSFDIAVLELYLPLISGGTVTIATKEQAMDGEALKDIITNNKVTMMQATPSTWRLLLASGWTGDKEFKILCGGENFPKDLALKLIPLVNSVWNMYGPTETTVWSTCKQLNIDNEAILIGTPIDNTTVYVLDDNLKLLPIGKAGNLYIGGKGLAEGYYGKVDLTCERFISNPFVPGERMYHTGDLARFHANGELECLGRNDGQVKVRGYRIELGEIENVLTKISCVDQCVVITREDNPGDVRIVAYVITKPNQNFDQMQMRLVLSEKLPNYMIPSHFVVMNEFPKTLNEKIDKKRLPPPVVKQNEIKQIIIEDSNLIKMKQIWKDLLNVNDVAYSDNFFDIGGHSLLSVQLFSIIAEVFKVNLPLATLFEASTLEALTNKVIEKMSKSSVIKEQDLVRDSKILTSLIAINSAGSGNPVFCFHGVGGNVLNYLKLAPYIHNRPLYGLQSRGVDGHANPLKTISAMAAAYIAEMRLVQAYGPYTLAGGSMGGMIALEVAIQLQKLGEEVEHLIMFDTFGPNLDLKSYGSEKRNLWQNIKTSFYYKSKTLINALRGTIVKFFGLPIPHDIRYFNIEMSNYRALWSYRPGNYYGDLKLIRGLKTETGWYSDPHMGWEEVILGDIKTFEINGDHHNFVESIELGPTLQKILM